jgi:hypothetical protein
MVFTYALSGLFGVSQFEILIIAWLLLGTRKPQPTPDEINAKHAEITGINQ